MPPLLDDQRHAASESPAADLLVVGSGAAGLVAALSAASRGASVMLLTASELTSGSSPRAQGGVAVAIGPDDGPRQHAADTLAVGAGLNDRSAVDTLTRDGIVAVQALWRAGMPFDGEPGIPELGLEAGHRTHRILHAGGGATGAALVKTLLSHVIDHPRITVRVHARVSDLLIEDGRVRGARAGACVYPAHAVLLATGGYAALWQRTTNASESRGDGLAIAYRAGAAVADLEFVQFHPTALLLPGRPSFLLSEALRGEGARVVDEQEHPVVNPLLPRDQLARALASYRRERGSVFLSLRHLDAGHVRRRFSSLDQQLQDWGLDLARDLLPIAPAAHYCMGGIRTDVDGRTSVAGLYAAGEAACTGVQGANRLASNSLLECLVFGQRAASCALADRPQAAGWEVGPLPVSLSHQWNASVGTVASSTLAALLDSHLGIERDAQGLHELVTSLPNPDDPTTPNDVLVAALAARAALLRQESRGAHYRSDAPYTCDCWRGRIHWRREEAPQFERVEP
ncbi:MAG: FAD-dependent oxidoreductase [Chloroflexi bacterium]|nr:FAD-dependent oxidoreductase [Chloroflexota bacterium]